MTLNMTNSKMIMSSVFFDIFSERSHKEMRQM